MAEHLRKPGEAQDRPDDQNDHKSRNHVSDERCKKDATNHQFTKHFRTSIKPQRFAFATPS